MADKRGAALRRGDPVPNHPWRIVTDMLCVSAFQLSDPVTEFVLPEPDNPAHHNAAIIVTLLMIQNPLNESSLALPVLECLHILGFVCGIGTIALVNFRLLGVALTQKSPAQLWIATMPWTLGGLSLAIFSGILLFSIDPGVYYVNPVFLLKLAALLAAIAFYYTAVRGATASSNSRTVACISLGLWALVLFGGIFINGFSWVYPTILSLHIAALAFFGGLVVAVGDEVVAVAEIMLRGPAAIIDGLAGFVDVKDFLGGTADLNDLDAGVEIAVVGGILTQCEFSVQVDGFRFGLVDASKPDEDYESVHLLPNDFAFFAPWNGEFDT